jgi:hypothetical protein
LEKPEKQNRNPPQIPLHDLSWPWNGEVDPMTVKGISHSTVLAINSEVGLSIDRFPAAKAFTSRLRLSPSNRISAGKILSNHVRNGSNRLACAPGHAAESAGKQKDAHLYPFFQRISYRNGRCAAIIATAGKLAVIIWNMLTKKEKYTPYDTSKIVSQIRDKKINKINKMMKYFDVKVSEIKFAVA